MLYIPQVFWESNVIFFSLFSFNLYQKLQTSHHFPLGRSHHWPVQDWRPNLRVALDWIECQVYHTWQVTHKKVQCVCILLIHNDSFNIENNFVRSVIICYFFTLTMIIGPSKVCYHRIGQHELLLQLIKTISKFEKGTRHWLYVFITKKQ